MRILLCSPRLSGRGHPSPEGWSYQLSLGSISSYTLLAPFSYLLKACSNPSHLSSPSRTGPTKALPLPFQTPHCPLPSNPSHAADAAQKSHQGYLLLLNPKGTYKFLSCLVFTSVALDTADPLPHQWPAVCLTCLSWAPFLAHAFSYAASQSIPSSLPIRHHLIPSMPQPPLYSCFQPRTSPLSSGLVYPTAH